MVSAKFEVTIMPDDLQAVGIEFVTQDLLDDVSQEMESIFQEDYFRHILKAALLDIGALA